MNRVIRRLKNALASLFPSQIINSSEHHAFSPTALNALIVKLPVEKRFPYLLHDVEGMSYKVIADYLLIDEAEARRLVHSARLELRQHWLANI